MSRDIEQHVDTNSAEFKHGKDDEPVSKSLLKETSIPLFMSDSSEGNKGNAQDEKDETEE